jgi:acetyl esterase/lipase
MFASALRPVAPSWLLALAIPCALVAGGPLIKAAPATEKNPLPSGGESKTSAGVTIPPMLQSSLDQVYWQQDKSVLKLDVIAPPKGSKGLYPAVILLHGGGWIWGDYKSCVPLAVKLAERGFVAVIVRYRFTTTNPFPAQVHDVKNAVRWLRANAAKFDVDPNKIGAHGHSAGGHLALMLGLPVPTDGLEGKGGDDKERSDVQCVVSLSSLTDLTELHACCGNGRLTGLNPTALKIALEKFLETGPEKANGRYSKASPIAYARKGIPVPPVLLIHGSADNLIPFEQSERLYKKLKHVEADVSLLAVHGASHDFRELDADIVDAATIAFFDRKLKR